MSVGSSNKAATAVHGSSRSAYRLPTLSSEANKNVLSLLRLIIIFLILITAAALNAPSLGTLLLGVAAGPVAADRGPRRRVRLVG